MKRFRNILVATDFSSASRPAFRYAIELAAASGARLWVAHVVAPRVTPVSGGGVPRIYREMDAFVLAGARKRLEAWTRAAQAGKTRARPLLLRGLHPEAIRRAARAVDADLLVVGTHGHTGLARVFLGSVAARIIATAPCPVLSVRRRHRGSVPRRVLFATDFSDASKQAWKQALSLARANRAALQIVHAQAPLAEGQPVRWAYAEAEAQIRADAGKRLQALVGEARRAGVRAEGLLLRGVPREAIVRASRSLKNAWIVVGTHGRTGLAGAFLGSVASRVVATAPCPVLTVRGAKRA